MLTLALCFVLAAPPAVAAPAPPAPTWEETLDRVTPAVVAIKVTATRNFDTEAASTVVGTGFVIDAKNGLILTNRHMVYPGPVKAEAVFLDHEEVDLQPIYRDPVHDFGVFRFDPSKVRYQGLVELPLAPEAARVGMEIRVVGNDAGEKISILDGTLARLDRNAPDYGGNSFNDFNTFYLQAASNTSGGSSGSPVLDIRGRAVALNAGGRTRAASSFYLPLWRVVRALDYIRRGEVPPRGTIMTVFDYTAYDELRRLGLREDSEAAFRAFAKDGTGALVVSETVPGGPGRAVLQPGDVLIRVDGALVADFVSLESVLDDRVGGTVKLEVERGGQPFTFDVPVRDLHAITPASYFELGRGVVNDLSYQQARNHNLPLEGVYVASAGYMLGNGGIADTAVIVEVDGVPTPDVDAFQAEIEKKADGARVRVRYFYVSDPARKLVTVVPVDRTWFAMTRCTRDVTGDWPCVDSPPPPPPSAPVPSRAIMLGGGSKAARVLGRSLVMVDFDVPYPTEGIKDFHYQGTGVVVDAEHGLVLVDRDTVPVALGDLSVTFGGTVRLPAEIEYVHPEHDIALIKYDPSLLWDTPVASATFRDVLPDKGDKLVQVALKSDFTVVSSDVKVTARRPVFLGLDETPRFRDSNLEAVEVDGSVSSVGGVLADKRGRVVAQWASFLDQSSENRSFYGMTWPYLRPVVEQRVAGWNPKVRTIGAELWPLSLGDAKDRGLSDARLAQLATDPDYRKVLEVLRITGGTDAKKQLREGDLLLEIDGEPVTRLTDVEIAAQREHLRLVVLREGEEVPIELDTTPLDGGGVDKLVSWGGLILHDPHHDVAMQKGIDPDGVYISWMWYGTPAQRYGLRPTRRIVEVDGKPTPDCDAFVAAVQGYQDGQSVRLKMVALDGKVQVVTMKLDLDYWPGFVLDRDGGAWRRTAIE